MKATSKYRRSQAPGRLSFSLAERGHLPRWSGRPVVHPRFPEISDAPSLMNPPETPATPSLPCGRQSSILSDSPATGAEDQHELAQPRPILRRRRSPDLEVNTGPGLPKSGGGALKVAPVPIGGIPHVCRCFAGCSSQQRSTREFNLEELEAGLVQSDPSYSDSKPPTGSTDGEIIIDFLRREQVVHGKEEVNRSRAEQDQSGPKAARSYVTTIGMIPCQNSHLGYWMEKMDVDEAAFERTSWPDAYYYGLKVTFQFIEYDGTITNWFMHEYIPTESWGIDLYLERLRFRVLEYKNGVQVPGKATSPEVKIIKKMLEPDDRVVKGESPVSVCLSRHPFRIYDRHPELEGSEVVYKVCPCCDGVHRAGDYYTFISIDRNPSYSPSSRPPLSQWEKGECIGCGAFGQVFLGFNSEHGQSCAIKEVPVILNDPRSKEQLSQLNQEIWFLKLLSHPNIVQYYGSIMTDDELSIYMEHVSMGSIHKLLANGPFKESKIRIYTAQILSGLAFMHERNHVHRDIKGANILVGPNDEVKIADFGLAKHISSLAEVHSSNKGTIYWMAPEVILSTHSGKGYNLSADIWSLGCTVSEMATGKPPLHHLEPVAAMFKIASDTYMPDTPDNLSDEGKHFFKLCLQRDPARRPSAAALLGHPFIWNQG